MSLLHATSSSFSSSSRSQHLSTASLFLHLHRLSSLGQLRLLSLPTVYICAVKDHEQKWLSLNKATKAPHSCIPGNSQGYRAWDVSIVSAGHLFDPATVPGIHRSRTLSISFIWLGSWHSRWGCRWVYLRFRAASPILCYASKSAWGSPPWLSQRSLLSPIIRWTGGDLGFKSLVQSAAQWPDYSLITRPSGQVSGMKLRHRGFFFVTLPLKVLFLVLLGTDVSHRNPYLWVNQVLDDFPDRPRGEANCRSIVQHILYSAIWKYEGIWHNLRLASKSEATGTSFSIGSRSLVNFCSQSISWLFSFLSALYTISSHLI